MGFFRRRYKEIIEALELSQPEARELGFHIFIPRGDRNLLSIPAGSMALSFTIELQVQPQPFLWWSPVNNVIFSFSKSFRILRW